MRVQRQDRRKAEGTAKLNLQTAQRSGALVVDAKEITFAREGREIISSFSTTIMRGDKVGLIGRNGAGKTTLLRLLLGSLKPDSGTIKLGTNLEIAYFDQLRDQLDQEQTVLDNVGDGSDRVKIGDKTKHIIGYLQDFLFSAERARTQIKFLSGGEKNRVLLAKLMTKPANVIVLDEPTNDLDSETLDLLENQLVDFQGTLLLVSHDRTFLNNVVTSTIVFEDDGINEYVGGYDNWMETIQRRRAAELNKVTEAATQAASSSGSAKAVTTGKKLTYKEQRELEQLPARIETIESQISGLHELMGDPEFYRRPPAEITLDQNKLKQLESDLANAYQTWELLAARA